MGEQQQQQQSSVIVEVVTGEQIEQENTQKFSVAPCDSTVKSPEHQQHQVEGEEVVAVSANVGLILEKQEEVGGEDKDASSIVIPLEDGEFSK